MAEMGSPSTAVADLVVKLHSNIDSINQCIQSLSDTSSHDAELERLETEREQKIAELRQAHENALKELATQREKEAKELAEKRKREEEELEEQRKREWEELMARRKKEDEERKAKAEKEEEERARVKREEDERRESERVETERSLQERVEAELEKLEDEMERKVEEGKKALRELDEKRKAINAQIDAALNTPTVIPTIQFRSRAKTLKGEKKDIAKGGRDVAAPLPPEEPLVNGSKDIHGESGATPVDSPNGLGESAADEAKEISTESRAEYAQAPMENSNVAVSDTSAESNANENEHISKEVEGKPEESASATKAPNVSGSEEAPADTPVEPEQTPAEHAVVETITKGIPTESKSHLSDSSEVAKPEVSAAKEAEPEVHNQPLEVQEEPINDMVEKAPHSEFIPETKSPNNFTKEESDEETEHPIESFSTPTSEVNTTVETKSIPDEESSHPPELAKQVVPEESPKLEESQSSEVPETDDTSGPEEKREIVDVGSDHSAANATWQKDDHVETSVPVVSGETGWFSKSLFRFKGAGVAPSEPVNMVSVNEATQLSEASRVDEGESNVPSPEVKNREISKTPASATSVEEADGSSQPMEVDNEHEQAPQIPDAEALPADEEDDNLVEEIVHISPDQAPDTNVDHNQHIPSEGHSPPLQNVEAQPLSKHHEDTLMYTEGNEEGLAPESTEIPEIQPSHASHEEDLEQNKVLASHADESSFPEPNSNTLKTEPTQPELTTVTEVSLPDAGQHEVETTEGHDLRSGADGYFKDPTDETRDTLDEFDVAPHDDQNGNYHEDRPLPHGTTSPVTEMGHHELPNERPSTPIQASNTFDFAPSTPGHLIQESHHGFAESPNTVLDAEDLFADDDDDEDEHQGHAYEKGVEHDISKETTAQSAPHFNEDYEGPDPNTAEAHAPLHRSSGYFASLVETITPDLVKQIVNHNSSPAYHPLEDNRSVSKYAQTTADEHHIPESLQNSAPFPPQEPDAGLHIRTHTADTIPSFASYAPSDDASTPTTPSETASSPFQENPGDEPNIRSSWQDNSALPGSDSIETQQELKPQASPLQAEFDPYNSQTYPNYISPKSNQANIETLPSPRYNSFGYSGGVDAPRPHDTTSPSLQRKSPHLSSLNTSYATPFRESRPYDSPISATRSDHEPSLPSPSRIPRRSTDRSIVPSRTPVSSPSTTTNNTNAPSTFFQKTRSLFESASTSSPSPPRPLSSLFTTKNRDSPSPPRRSPSRPSSLLLSAPGEEILVPRNLDNEGKPPSPAFSLPGSASGKGNAEGGKEVRHRSSNPFLDGLGLGQGLSRLVGGSGGLEDSVHNPNRFKEKEKEPLLGEGGY